MGIILEATEEFELWLSEQPAKYEVQIRKRLLSIEQDGRFGDWKSVGDEVFELRWKNGRRVYFVRTGQNRILLLLGGEKNEQKKQIKKAKLMCK